jgi:hypothetical protein
VAPVRWAFEALGQITDLDTHFQTDNTQLGAGLAVAYGNSFLRNPAENWVILALFAIAPIVLTCVVPQAEDDRSLTVANRGGDRAPGRGSSRR